MNTVYLPLVVDSYYRPLTVEKQLTVSLMKSVPSDSKLKKAILLGWPLLLVKNENTGGYLIFDETLNLETRIQFTILQDYKRLLDNIERSKDDTETLAIVKSFRWADIRGKEEEIYKGVVNEDLTPILSYGSETLPLRILERNITQLDIDAVLNNMNNREKEILSNINLINEIESKLVTIFTILKGKKAEERKQVEDKYNSLLEQKNEVLKNVLVTSKKNLETELYSEAEKLYSKMSNIEVLLGKAELDYEADKSLKKDFDNLIQLRNKYLDEIQNKLSEIKNKYKLEIRNIVHEIETIKNNKQNEINIINARIKELDELQNKIISQLESLKNMLSGELEKIRTLSKRAPYDNDKVEVILPFLITINSYSIVNKYSINFGLQ